MAPVIDLNWWAILAAVIVSFIIGALWYTVLFGAVWRREMGMPETVGAPPAGVMARSLIINLIGTILVAIALAYLIAEYRPSAWGAAGEPAAPILYGLYGGFFPWLGFVVPILLNSVAFEGRSWRLFAINAGLQLVCYVVMALILAFWR